MPDKPSPTLLLVDNNPEFAYLIERYAETSGWKMVWAKAVNAAEESLTAQAIDLILLNVNLPPAAGWDFLRALKTDPGRQNIPVAVYSSVPDEAQAEKEGADFYLWQPILYPDFARVLNQVLLLE